MSLLLLPIKSCLHLPMHIFRETALHHQEYINALVRQVKTIPQHTIS